MTEQLLYNCCVSLGSNKATERKKCLEQLKSLLDSREIIQFLKYNSSVPGSRNVTWDTLLESTHGLVLKETDEYGNDKRKASVSATTISRHENMMTACTSLLTALVKKANIGSPKLRGSYLVTMVMEVLSTRHLRESVGQAYLMLLLDQVLTVTKYCADISHDRWNELLTVCMELYCSPPPRMQKTCVARVLCSVVEHGVTQSFLALTIKNKLTFVEEAFKDPALKKSTSLQAALLRLSLLICTKLAVESRTAICQLGEAVLPSILATHRVDDLPDKKGVMLDLLLLLVRVHHPHGAGEGEGAAHAHSWDRWRRQLKAVYSVVETEMRNVQRPKFAATKPVSVFRLPDNFLDLSVSVCKQVYGGSSNVLEVTQLNESVCESGPKRRRLAVGIPALMDALGSLARSNDGWPWLALLVRLLQQHPAVVEEADFLPLLQLTADLMSTCKHADIINYLCQCCVALISVEQHLLTTSATLHKTASHTLWKQIWDTTLRTVGLNQSEEGSHALLQSLLTNELSVQHAPLVHMFASGTIKLTSHSLRTLETVCRCCTVPEESWRSSLLDWCLPEECAADLQADEWARVAVGLAVKGGGEPGGACLEDRGMEDSLAASCFEGGLLVPEERSSREMGCSGRRLVDAAAGKKLLDTVNRLCETRMPGLKTLMAHVDLVMHILSNMLRLRLLETSALAELMSGLVTAVTSSTRELLEREGPLSDKLQALASLTRLYQAPYHADVHVLLQVATPADFLQAVYHVAKTRVLPIASVSVQAEFEGTSDDDVDWGQPERGERGEGLLDVNLLSDHDKFQASAVTLLAAFSCGTGGTELNLRGKKAVSAILELLVDSFVQTRPSDFLISATFLRIVLRASTLDEEQVSHILSVIQAMCKSRHSDAEAAVIILGLIQGLCRHVASSGLESQQDKLLSLLQAFKRLMAQHKFGPKAFLQYLSCLDTVAKVDPASVWAIWDCGTPVGEEILVHLSSPSHEVRMSAAGSIAALFTGVDQARESRMFDKLRGVVMASFVVEGELTLPEMTDESANRTASALHALAALVLTSPRCRRKALFSVLQLVQERNVSTALVHKVLRLVGRHLKLADIDLFMKSNLNYLLVRWLDLYPLQAFPWALVGSCSERAFYSDHLDAVVPTLLYAGSKQALVTVCHTLDLPVTQVLEACYPHLTALFLPCLAAAGDPALGNGRRMYAVVGELMSKERVDSLLTSKLSQVVVSLFRLLYDPDHLETLCGCRPVLPDPDLPCYSAQAIDKTLLYLQENTPYPDLPLAEFLVTDEPASVEQILLSLAVDIHRSPTSEDRLLALHRYASFASTLVASNLHAMAHFSLRSVTLTLVHLVRGPDLPLAAAACHALRCLLRACLPLHAATLEPYLRCVVGALIPAARSPSALGPQALALLRLLILDHCDVLLAGVRGLDPFPCDALFQDMQQAYVRVSDRESRSALEDEIRHFLDSGRGKTGCQAEGLIHIRAKLSEKKRELNVMYKELVEMRGFSEDCSHSLLHQLICQLVRLTADPDKRMSTEAARCLGELGPADLTTMVLRPEATPATPGSPVATFTSLAADLLVDYLVNRDVDLAQAASLALYALLASDQGRNVKGKERKLLLPFLRREGRRSGKSPLVVDEERFQHAVDSPTLWCPPQGSHEQWITDLAVTLLGTFRGLAFKDQLAAVCRVKVSFSEEMLPYLVELVMCHGSAECSTIISRSLRLFFRNHFQRLHTDSEQTKHSKDQVCLNRASVQCMLNVVSFIRLQRSASHDSLLKNNALDLDYLHLAVAAQFCLAYFTSILYAELWCNSFHTREPGENYTDDLHTFSTFDYISSQDPQGGQTVQNLLREAYTRIGDSDAIYGCGSSHLLDPKTRVRHYELLGNWGDAMLHYDLELSAGNLSATPGLLAALEKLGVHHVRHGYQQSTGTEDLGYDCLWRLGQWGAPVATSHQWESGSADYEKHHYLALRALSSRDMGGLESAVASARQCVVESLANASLESSKSLYPALSQLQILQEMEDLAAAGRDNQYQPALRKWQLQDLLGCSDFLYREPILAQRSVMVGLLMGQGAPLSNALADTLMATATLAREERAYHVARRSLGRLGQISDLPSGVRNQLTLEDARVSWERGDQEVGKVVLQSLLRKFSVTPPRGEPEAALYSSALRLYGSWMVETRSENPQVIIERYFKRSLSVLGGRGSPVDTYVSLASYADAQYQQISRYLRSSEFRKKREVLEGMRSDAVKLRKDSVMESKKAVSSYTKQSDSDQTEIDNTQAEKDAALVLAMQYYMLSLETGDSEKHDMQVFRFVSLWLENKTNQVLDDMLSQSLSKIPSYKFLPLLPQLAPRMGVDQSDPFIHKLNTLLERCAREHPHHTLPLILALANSFKDKDYSKEGPTKNAKITEVRVLGAKEMISRLRKDPSIGHLVQQSELLASAFIELANLEAKGKGQVQAIAPSSQLRRLKRMELVLVPSVTIPVVKTSRYTSIVGIERFEDSFSLVGGVNAPKKLICLGTDGVKRPQLLKGKDDLRQDAVMQQVFTLMNSLLKNNKDTHKRKLIVRTYKVVPLSQRSGILEWCQDTDPIGVYLVGSEGKPGAHKKYYPKDISVQDSRKRITEASSKSNEQKLKVYLEVTSQLHPVFHLFFLENFPTPGVWFERRLAYIHSVATTSMIGYILGLGDRHVQNILIDRVTAEVIHIDFGIAFDQGKHLPIPETVPFRLTRDIEDGMGVSGVEGVFRRCCEKTMCVLRENQETILTILEVLLYDPLYAWSVTPTSKAFNVQRNSRHKEPDASQATPVAVNKLAERALLRLQQKLQGTEEGMATSVSGQVNRLIQQARDPANLSRLFAGWQAYL